MTAFLILDKIFPKILYYCVPLGHTLVKFIYNQSICYQVARRNKRTSAKMILIHMMHERSCDRVTTTFAKLIFTTTIYTERVPCVEMYGLWCMHVDAIAS